MKDDNLPDIIIIENTVDLVIQMNIITIPKKTEYDLTKLNEFQKQIAIKAIKKIHERN